MSGSLLTVFSVFLVGFGIGATRVEIDSNDLKDFWKSSWIYNTTVKVDTEMGGTTNVVYLFDAGEDDGVKNPEVLREIDRLQQLANVEDWLVTKTYSIVDIVKDLSQSFHGDDPAYHAIPETWEAIAQYLLLYESSGGEEVEEYISSDYRRANLELRLKMDATAAMERLVAGLDAHLEEVPLEHSSVSLTGIGALWLVLMDYILSSQIQGFTIAFAIITLVMIGIFRSIKIGVISMVPNLAPVFLALGAMGWLGISLDYTKATIAAIALGISVDDTIHLMTRFHHEFGKSRDYERALRAALGDVGRGLLITSTRSSSASPHSTSPRYDPRRSTGSYSRVHWSRRSWRTSFSCRPLSSSSSHSGRKGWTQKPPRAKCFPRPPERGRVLTARAEAVLSLRGDRALRLASPRRPRGRQGRANIPRVHQTLNRPSGVLLGLPVRMVSNGGGENAACFANPPPDQVMRVSRGWSCVSRPSRLELSRRTTTDLRASFQCSRRSPKARGTQLRRKSQLHSGGRGDRDQATYYFQAAP